MVFGGSFLFRKVAILGVGLVGGSLGKALKKNNLVKEVFGVSRRKEALAIAIKSGAIDVGTHDIKKAVINADLVVMATPVNVVSSMFKLISPHLKRGCVVTDVGSTKVSIVAAAQEVLSNPSMFVGSHPLAGSEKRGVEFATEDLFKDSICIMTPLDSTNRGAVDRVKRMWTAIGAIVKTTAPDEHDKMLAYISHLPHLAAYALMSSVPEDYLTFAAQGLKDTTRIVASSPEVWNSICMANSENIIKVIDEYAGNLSILRKAIIDVDEKALTNELKKAKIKRDKIV